jgi:ABC-2 type transport system ATP-binding protein
VLKPRAHKASPNVTVMPRISIPGGRRGRWAIFALVVLLIAGSVVLWTRGDAESAVVRTQDATIDVPDSPGSAGRVHLDATLYTPERTPAPAVLLPHGFGGSKESVAGQARELTERGFVVLTYSARGFGRSTGQIALNDPDREVADAQRLIDYLATRPEVLNDHGDPRIGVTGASYGGALALLLAGVDKRVDAIAPVIAYNDLTQALLPNDATTAGSHPDASSSETGIAGANTPAASASESDGVFKRAWAGLLFSSGASSTGASSAAGTRGIGSSSTEAPEAGQTTSDNSGGSAASSGSTAVGQSSQGPAALPGSSTQTTAPPANPCGRFTPEICQAYTELATTGRASQQTIDLLKRISPASVTARITAPTLLVQGENDTLFGLDQSDATAREIHQSGTEVKTIWYAGGHDGGSPGPMLRGKIADWLFAKLTGQPDDLPPFSYDVQGALRASGSPSVRTIEASSYPGLDQGNTTQRRQITLNGPQQAIVNPPGGVPASVTGIPGLNGLASSSSQLARLFGIDVPGQSAQFASAPLDSQLLIAGASSVRLNISALPSSGLPSSGSPSPGAPSDAVLFAKLYDVGPDGNRTLPANAVAPLRVPGLSPGSGAREVTVTLPGIVRPVEAGHSLQLVVSTTDQSYSGSIPAAAFQISLAGGGIPGAGTLSGGILSGGILSGGILSAPVVPGTSVSAGWPVKQVLAILGILLAAAIIATLIGLRRRSSSKTDAELSSTPLVISGLTKSYPGGLKAVDDLSFRVDAGQVLGLLGPNGAGKTTTLRMLMGLIKPTAGEITVFGHRIRSGAPVLSQVGSFVEGSGFLPHLSGRINLALYWEATGRPKHKAHIAEALEIAGLGNAIDRKVRTYSQGMRQRLAIAQAMLGLPNLLVLDEPTNGLDPPQIHQMREVLRRYADTGRTVVISSHLLSEVEQTCTHVVVMHRGRLVASGTVEEIVSAGNEVSFQVDRPEAAAEVLRAELGVSAIEISGNTVHADLSETSTAQAIGVLVGAQIAITQAKPRRRLEDVFLQLVGSDSSE